MNALQQFDQRGYDAYGHHHHAAEANGDALFETFQTCVHVGPQQLDVGLHRGDIGFEGGENLGQIRFRGDIPGHGVTDRRHHCLGLGVVESGFLEGFDGLVGVEHRAHGVSMPLPMGSVNGCSLDGLTP